MPPHLELNLMGVDTFMHCLVQIMANQVHFFLFPPLLLDCRYLCWAVPHYTKCRNDSFPLLIDVVDITAFGCFISLQVIIFYNLAAWWKLMIIIVLQQCLNLKGILHQVWEIARVDIFGFNHSNITFLNQFGSLGFDEINSFRHWFHLYLNQHIQYWQHPISCFYWKCTCLSLWFEQLICVDSLTWLIKSMQMVLTCTQSLSKENVSTVSWSCGNFMYLECALDEFIITIWKCIVSSPS